MPDIDSKQAMDKFMNDLEQGKFKRERVPNPPPYFEGTKEEIENEEKTFSEFLESDLFESLKNLT